MIKKKRTHTRIVFISDIHIPYQDKKALAMAMDVIKDYNLNEEDSIIIGGDLVDYYPISSFSPDLTSSNIDLELFEAVSFSLKATMNNVCKRKLCHVLVHLHLF